MMRMTLVESTCDDDYAFTPSPSSSSSSRLLKTVESIDDFHEEVPTSSLSLSSTLPPPPRFHHRQQQVQGNLPLKKRRFNPLMVDSTNKDENGISSFPNIPIWVAPGSSDSAVYHSKRTVSSLSSPPPPLHMGENEEKMAVLALIAASTLESGTETTCDASASDHIRKDLLQELPTTAAKAAAASVAIVPVTPTPSRAVVSDPTSLSWSTIRNEEDSVVSAAAMAITSLSSPNPFPFKDIKKMNPLLLASKMTTMTTTTNPMWITPIYRHSIVTPHSTPVTLVTRDSHGVAVQLQDSSSFEDSPRTSTTSPMEDAHPQVSHDHVDEDCPYICATATMEGMADTTIVPRATSKKTSTRPISSPGNCPPSPSPSSTSNSSSSSSSSNSSVTPTPTSPLATKRMHHPRLASPLPGGCHGKTSRNNSYCRRQPCFHGSNYCKLHYQQYINALPPGTVHHDGTDPVAFEGTVNARTPTSSSPVELSPRLQKRKVEQSTIPDPPQIPAAAVTALVTTGTATATATAANRTTTKKVHHPPLLILQAPVVPNITTIHQQDKRYTGADGEVRCQATTTRGRPCAYVAVTVTVTDLVPDMVDDCQGSSKKSKYCHLHADYDTNPPPRRNKASSSSMSSSTPASEQQQQHERISILRQKSGPFCSGGGRTGSSKDGVCLETLDVGSNFLSTTFNEDVPTVMVRSSKSSGRPSSKTDATNLAAVVVAAGTTKNLGTGQQSISLLSMISTDQWYQKRVIMATGPLVNCSGRVERWGNGWVSVRMEDVVQTTRPITVVDDGSSSSSSVTGSSKKNTNIGGTIHNRRSFELVLHPDQD